MQKYAIIVAGGKGSRMGGKIPKQFLLLKSRPVLMHTLEAFYRRDRQISIILVLPHDELSRWQDLCRQYDFTVPHQIASGGSNRTESVRNGLAKIPAKEGLVAIHDGVRPLVDDEIIRQSYETAKKEGCAIAAVALKDSIRWSDGYENKALDRSQYRLIQTPQTFILSGLRTAYDKIGKLIMTDDASVYEYAGHAVHMIEGSYRNIKITTPEDLRIAEALWQ